MADPAAPRTGRRSIPHGERARDPRARSWAVRAGPAALGRLARPLKYRRRPRRRTVRARPRQRGRQTPMRRPPRLVDRQRASTWTAGIRVSRSIASSGARAVPGRPSSSSSSARISPARCSTSGRVRAWRCRSTRTWARALGAAQRSETQTAAPISFAMRARSAPSGSSPSPRSSTGLAPTRRELVGERLGEHERIVGLRRRAGASPASIAIVWPASDDRDLPQLLRLADERATGHALERPHPIERPRGCGARRPRRAPRRRCVGTRGPRGRWTARRTPSSLPTSNPRAFSLRWRSRTSSPRIGGACR